MPALLGYPNVAGLYPDWARIAVGISGLGPIKIPTKAWRAMSYKDRTNGELAMGNSQLPVGQTSGQIMPELASFTLLLPEYQILRAAIAGVSAAVSSSLVSTVSSAGSVPGFGVYTRLFNMLITYGGRDAAGVPYTIVDFLFGCRIAGSENQHRSGGGPLEVTFPVQPTILVLGGIFPDDVSDFADMQSSYIQLLNAVGGAAVITT